MKSINYIFCIVFLTLVLAKVNYAQSGNESITGKVITSDAITGEATSQTFGASVYVIGLPSLVLHSPINQTYLFDRVLLNYSVSGASYVWYKLDNGTNVTINQSVYINVTQGNHTLFIYANNSGELTVSRNVTFSVNVSSFNIKNGKYDSQNSSLGNYSGNSTNFRDYSFSEIQNLSNVIIENSQFGRIFFPVVINLTNDANPNDGIIDMESYINISFNRIEINSSALPNFNKSATLRLTGLTFSNPRILFNGQECPASICIKESYSNGILTFNVTHFSTFSAEETLSGSQESGGTGSTGGGSSISAPKSKEREKAVSFSIKPDKLKTSLLIGETRKLEIRITNEGKEKLVLNITQRGLENIVDIREKDIVLEPRESRTIIIDFIAREDILPDTYIGKIILSSESGEETEILTAVDISSKKSLFDVKLEIPQRFQVISPGEDLIVITSIFSLGRTGRVDVNLAYFIKDEEGNVILTDEETNAVETQLELLNQMKIPENMKEGTYVFYVKVKYEGEIAVASTTFTIKKSIYNNTSALLPLKTLLYLLAILIITIIMLLLYNIVQLITTTKDESQRIEGTIKEKTKVLKQRTAVKIIKQEPKVELYYE